MGKQTEAEQRPHQQTPARCTAPQGQSRSQGEQYCFFFFRKSRSYRNPMTMCGLQGTQLDHPKGLEIMPEGQASRAPNPPSNTTTLGKWCQQGCPTHLLRSSCQRREHGSQKPRQRQNQGGQGGRQKKNRVFAAGVWNLPDESPLRPDFEAQLQSVQAQLKDKRSKGTRLDSAEARLRRRSRPWKMPPRLWRGQTRSGKESENPRGSQGHHGSHNGGRTNPRARNCAQARFGGRSRSPQSAPQPADQDSQQQRGGTSFQEERAGTTREQARPIPRTTHKPTRSCTEPWA